MPITIEREEGQSLIHVEGEFTVTSAAELKQLLLDGFASNGDLRLDLMRTEAIDVTLMQLLWTAGREAHRRGVGIEIRVPEALETTAREAGFASFPGTRAQE